MIKIKKIGLLLFMAIVFLLVYEPNYKAAQSISKSNLLIVAHRGFGNYGPDNSLSAVKMAIEANVDGVDLDGQMTSDGKLVIYHDPNLDRLSDGKGPLKEKTLAELKALDVGFKFDEKFRGERIATYEEALRIVNGKVKLIVELKTSTVGSDSSENIAVGLIQKYNAYDWTILSSFNPFVLYRIKKLDKKVKTMFIFKDVNVDPEILSKIHPTDSKGIPWVLRNDFCRSLMRRLINPDFLSAEITVNKNTVKKLIDKGYPLFLWPPNDEKTIKESIGVKPYGVITDEPILAKEIIVNL